MGFGGVPERSNGAVLKTAGGRKVARGFKSHPRRLQSQNTIAGVEGGVGYFVGHRCRAESAEERARQLHGDAVRSNPGPLSERVRGTLDVSANELLPALRSVALALEESTRMLIRITDLHDEAVGMQGQLAEALADLERILARLEENEPPADL
jgi:hypothetical protein